MGGAPVIARSPSFPVAALLIAAMAGCGSTAPASSGGAGGATARAGQASPTAPRVWQPAAPDSLGPTVAIVGSRRFRAHEIDSLIQTAPVQAQQQLKDRDGYKRLLDRLTAEESVYQAAERSGIERDPQFRAELAKARRDLLVRSYYQVRMAEAPTPPDSAVEGFYKEHEKEFTIPARVRVRHIQVATRAKAESIRKQLVQGGLWDALCRANSTDAKSKNDGGILGFVTPATDLVPGLGKAPAVVAAAFELKDGGISQPLKTDAGWQLIRADNYEPERVQPLADLSGRIRDQLRSQAQDEYSRTLLDSLKTASNTVVFDDSIDVVLSPVKTPQDLFQAAQSATSPQDRIKLYRDVVKSFPEDSVSVRAAFMIGFTYAEDLQDYNAARTAFQDFIQRYPKSDLVSSATWMMQNMDKPAPDLKDEKQGGEGGDAAPDSTR